MKLKLYYKGWLPIHTSRSRTEREWSILGTVYLQISRLKEVKFDDYGKRITDHT